MATTQSEFDSYLAGYQQGAERVLASTLRDPQGWLIEALGGSDSDAGIRVDYRESMSYAYVWSACSIIAGDVAALPLNVYRVEADGDEVVAPLTPAHWLLNGDASDWMSAYQLREVMTAHAVLLGNAYAYIMRRGDGQPAALRLLDPHKIKPVVDESDRSVYYQLGGRDNEVLRADDVLHISGLGYDGVQGHSVLYLARNSFGLGIAQQRHGARHFRNGAQPSIVLKHPKILDKEKAESLLDMFELRHGGSENSGKPALAAGGLDLQVLPINNQDAQWLESRKFSRVEVAAWFQLPPHKLGDDSRTAYNSIEAENRSYIGTSLRRWLRRWETEAARKLLPAARRRRGQLLVRHDPKPLLETDTPAKVDYVLKMFQGMAIQQNEARTMLGLPRVAGGDVFFNPNTTIGGAPVDPAEPAPEPETETLAAMRDLVDERLGRLLRAAGSAACRAAGKPDSFMAFAGGFADDWRPKFGQCLALFAAAARRMGLSASRPAALADSLAAELVENLYEAAGATPDKLDASVAEAVEQWPDTGRAVVDSFIDEASSNG